MTRGTGSTRYAWYVAVLLMLTYAVQHIDRQIMAVVLEPVKAEFELSDSELGLLSGLAFAVAYSLAVIPIGILIDRGHRRNILAAALALWSGMTAVGSLATSYVQLVAARLLVGAAESGGNPASISILSDYFDRQRRSSAVGVYFFGQGIGILAGFALGGFIVAQHGWRTTLLIAGLPGLFLAAMIMATVREPERHGPAAPTAAGGMAASLALIWRRRGLFWLIFGMLFSSAMMAAILIWIVSFLVRTHSVDVRTAGLAVGIGMGLSGAAGAAMGGFVADWVGRQRPRNIPLQLALTQALSLGAYAIAFTHGNYLMAVIAASLGLLLSHTRDGPVFALCASLVGPSMRGKIMAIILLLNNLVGYGLGPLIAGSLSDFYADRVGDLSLRYAMLTIVALGAIGIVPFLLAARHVEAELQAAETEA